MFLSIIECWLSWWLWCKKLAFLSEVETNEFVLVSCVNLAKGADCVVPSGVKICVVPSGAKICVVPSGVKVGWGRLSWLL